MSEPSSPPFACKLESYLNGQVFFERPDPSAHRSRSHSVMIPYEQWSDLGRPEWVAVTVSAVVPKEDTDD